jgi:threonine dehydrogenase-like Zn-dependent dehydrogenase
LRAETLPGAADGLLAVRTLASGISRGTEALVFQGRVPPSQYAAMRAPLMAGTFPFPVKYGYAAVGLDDAGRRVFVLHPHQDRFMAPRGMAVVVPDDVPTQRAVLAANMETALNIVWDAAPLAGERVAVIGAGVVGLLVAALLGRMPGAAVTVVDVRSARAHVARRFGCGFAQPDDAPAEQELIVHASGTEAGLLTALACAGFEARIVEASWFGTTRPALPLGESFHARRLRIIASQVGAVAPAMRGRRTHAERLALALDVLRDPMFDLLLDRTVAFSHLPRDMPDLLRDGLCHVVAYDAE